MRPNHWFGVVFAVAILGGASPEVEAKGAVKVTFTTTPAPNTQFTPNNVIAVWIQNQAGTPIRTIARYSAIRNVHLVSYGIASGNVNEMLPADAITGASRLSHAGSVTVLWNLRDKLGNVVPDGTYTIRLELSESATATAADNNQGTFTFIKGPSPQMQTNLSNGGFTNVTIAFDPNSVNCGDGVVDMPETCDPAVMGSCIVNQSGCVPATDACMPNVFQGDPAMCTAACAVQPITGCANGDMCCPAGCDETTDTDCEPGAAVGEEGPDTVTAGCTTGGNAGRALAIPALFGLVLLFARRRR